MNRLSLHARMLFIPGILLIPAATPAAVVDLQTAAADHPELVHQYTFDGIDEPDRMADKKGGAHLAVNPFGSGTAGDLTFGVQGFDESSSAVVTSRAPGNDFAGGASLKTNVVLGDAVSFEVIFQPSQASISEGNFNLGYIVCTRVDAQRGYFLVQGNAPLPSTGEQLSSTMGGGFTVGNQTQLLDNVIPGHWYYAAGSYRINQETGTVTWTTYLADLTAGETELAETGPFTNSGGTYPTGGSPLGIGGRWDAGESFPGFIDEVNLYGAELTRDDFQAHLDLLTGAGLQLNVVRGEPGLIFTWESECGMSYHIRSETVLSGAPSTWPIFRGDIVGTPPLNNLVLLLSDEPRFFILEAFETPPVEVLSDDFELDRGWTASSGSGLPFTLWQRAQPAADGFGPAAAFSGNTCFGTNIAGKYGANVDLTLRSPPIDLTTACSATLTMQHHVAIDGPPTEPLGNDVGSIRVLKASDNSLLGVVESPIAGTPLGQDWAEYVGTLPAEALGDTIKLEFRLQSDNDGFELDGWYIDDVVVTVP